ncbi:MAG: hydroxymyristoyl-ACP dehydratase, partial [Rhizobacter sp.]|nr:hydroxymyristoyl-ACP dehydratase [Rhizobacter sp.]
MRREEIDALIPHSGDMCLLDRLDGWDARHVVCSASNHRDPGHPLRTPSGLLATCLIEYAAQAMALHGALSAQADGRTIRPGYLASVRGVQLHCLRLDDLPAAEPDELRIETVRQAGDDRQILYTFTVHHAGRPLADGRAA